MRFTRTPAFIVRLPENDSGCPVRLRLIKARFPQAMPKTETASRRASAKTNAVFGSGIIENTKSVMSAI
ncbi:hypothetical protein ACFPVS_04235 [Neisseria weixii]|uniref:hypothetical protein n=1 Tax=Neisseria weixii TaxID=1853276 RepID=UPI001E65404B|nr:hypothetical protein [Neisseria weixii]